MMSSNISRTAVVMYIAYTLMVVPGAFALPCGFQLFDNGIVWHKVAKKNVMNHATMTVHMILMATAKLGVTKIRL